MNEPHGQGLGSPHLAREPRRSLGRRLRRALKRGLGGILGVVLGRWLLPRRTDSRRQDVTSWRQDVRAAGLPASVGRLGRILVIRVDERVGNVLLTTPLLGALREAFPAARLEVLVAASKVRLVEGLAEVIPFERRDAFRRPLAFFALLARLRRARYDLAIDASHWHELSLSSSALLAWTGAPIRIAHDRPGAGPFASVLAAVAPGSYEVDAKLGLLRPLGIEASVRTMSTPVGRAGSHAAVVMDRWIEDRGLTARPIVGLTPGARKVDHRLPVALFAALAREAKALGAVPLVLWGPGEEALAQEVAASSGGVAAPPTDLAELAALMRRCRAVVTNDTGPMHLSVACGTPTIAFFAMADHTRWGHRGAAHAVIPADGRPLEALVAEGGRALRKVLGIGDRAH